MKPRRPTEIAVGRAYRMWSPFRSGPSEQIAVVTKIGQPTRNTRTVTVEWLLDGPGWNTTSYSDFLSRVFCETSLH